MYNLKGKKIEGGVTLKIEKPEWNNEYFQKI